MEQEVLETVSANAVKKYAFFSGNWRKFWVYAMMAGCYCSLGMAFAYSVGAGVFASPGIAGIYKLSIGLTFALSFTMIVFAGAELFTGNVMVMTIGALNGYITTRQGVRLLVFCYLANVAGAIFMALIVVATGLLNSPTGELLVAACMTKAETAFVPLMFRGILANVLVCLGTWMCVRIKNEAAKMMAITWVVVGFVTSGYEHSIANAGLFTMAALAPGSTPSLTQVMSVMVSSTIGNLIGGALFIGLVYWYSGRGEDAASKTPDAREKQLLTK